jgi:hypothetical protein
VQKHLNVAETRSKLPEKTIVLVTSKKEKDIFLLPEILKMLPGFKDFSVPAFGKYKEFSFGRGKTGLMQKTGILSLILKYSGVRQIEFKDQNLTDTIVSEILNEVRKDKLVVLFRSEFQDQFPDKNVLSILLYEIGKKDKDNHYIIISPTYDTLFSNKEIVHLKRSDFFQIKHDESPISISTLLNFKSSICITLTPGNLFSYALYSQELKEGISRSFLFYKMNRLANTIYREKYCVVARECLEQSYDELFAELMEEAINNGYMKYENKKCYGTKKLYEDSNPENIYLFHLDQLKLFRNAFQKIWQDVEVYD